MCPAVACFLCLLCLLLAAPAPGDLLVDYERDPGPFGVVYHRGWASAARADIVAFVDAKIREVEERLGGRLRRPVTLVLTPDRWEFQRIGERLARRPVPAWVVGLAFPGRRWILARGDSAPLQHSLRDTPSMTLVHEIAHLVLHGASATRLPRWFDEGVSMFVAGEAVPRRDESFLSGLARVDGLFPLEGLDRRFPEQHSPGALAYQQSFLMILFLVETHGEGVLGALLERLGAGASFPVAYREVTGRDWEALEPLFVKWVAARRPLWEAVASIASVWTWISILAVVAIVVSVLRTRRLRRKLEREDAGEAEDEEREVETTETGAPPPEPR